MLQPLGVVHILVSRETAKDGLPKHPGQCVSPILAGAGIGESFARQRRQPQRVVEFAIFEQPGIGGDDRTAKLNQQSAVEIEPQSPVIDSPAGFVMMEAPKREEATENNS
jgi:hypothetical protein